MADWPDGADLVAYVGAANAPTDTSEWAGIVAAATSVLRGQVDPTKLPEDDSCPDDLRLAILIYAHRLTTRKASATGVIAPGGADFAMRVGRADPDVIGLITHLRPDLDP